MNKDSRCYDPHRNENTTYIHKIRSNKIHGDLFIQSDHRFPNWGFLTDMETQ